MKENVMKGAIAYAIYFLPGDEEMKLITGLAEEVSGLLEGDGLKSGFVFAPYEESDACPKILIRSQALICGEECILSTFGKNDAHYNATENINAPLVTSRVAYEKAVSGLIEELKRNDDFEKAVLARSQEIPLSENFSAMQMLKLLKQKMPQAFCFLVCTPQAGRWIGATPERLLEVQGSRAYTNALAGTLPADGTDEWSEKEKVEQQIVTDYIAENLEKVGIVDYKKSEVRTIKSGTVKHLKTSFEFTVKDASNIATIIDVLHPTPAVGGMPLAKAKAAIKKYEQAPRKYYTGYLGPLGIGEESHLFVNLRSMQVNADTATLYIGAGITEDSVPEKEWVETEVKAKTLLNVINDIG